MSKIFISHASEDRLIIEKFADNILKLGLNIQTKDIFCSSIPGTRPSTGETWKDIVKNNLKDAEVVIMIITPNFKNSEMCQSEGGAAWALSKEILPLIIEPINYSSVGILFEDKQIDIITEPESLDRIKDKLEILLKIKSQEPSDIWTKLKHEFISSIKKYLKENPFKERCPKKKKCRILLMGYGIVLGLVLGSLLFFLFVRPILNNRYDDKPEGIPQSFISLGTEKEVGTSGEIKIKETFKYSPENFARYWVYFIDNDDYIWPQEEISSGQLKGVYFIPGGFKGGSLVLALVSVKTIEDYFTDGKVKKTPEFKIKRIVFETKIKIKNGGKYEKK
jgi:hypothetical protein